MAVCCRCDIEHRATDGHPITMMRRIRLMNGVLPFVARAGEHWSLVVYVLVFIT
jgi:hypothetical protein